MKTREGVVGDLVLFVACCLEFGAEECCHLEAGLVIARGELAFLDEGMEGCAEFDAEVVGGDVLGVEFQDFVDTVFPRCEGLGGQSVHQVEAEVGDAGVAEEVDGFTDVGSVVATAKEAELGVIHGLDAEGEAGDGGGGAVGDGDGGVAMTSQQTGQEGLGGGWRCEGPGAVEEVFGVGFEGDFFAIGEVETGGEGAEEGGDVVGA